MRWAEIFRSGAFRFALLFAAVFALGSAVLLIVVERAVARYALEATVGSLQSEVGVLKSEYDRYGLDHLVRAIGEHTRVSRERTFRYLVLDRGGHPRAGDLPTFVTRAGPGDVRYFEPGSTADQDGEDQQLKTLGVRLSGGEMLVVATDTYDIEELRRRVELFALSCGIGVTLFALVGGYIVAGRFLRRLERVNGAIEAIMAGDLAGRLPAIGMSPEFDQLSRNLNRMLDRIGGLMDGLRQVSSDIAHDLRTPLTRLRQGLESARDADAPEAYAAAIDDAIEQSDDILAIFRALLRIGTIEGGHGRARFARVDLSEVMERVHLAYRPVAEDAWRKLDARIAPGIVIRGDAALLAQMFTNLIENALAHTPGGASVTMSLASLHGKAVATVADDGDGIPKSERRNVLTRFYRLDASRNTPGAGLGLSLVAAIATLHDARLELGDNSPGLIVTLEFAIA